MQWNFFFFFFFVSCFVYALLHLPTKSLLFHSVSSSLYNFTSLIFKELNQLEMPPELTHFLFYLHNIFIFLLVIFVYQFKVRLC